MSESSDHDRHYNVLGLKRGASLPEIEDAWRLRSIVHHPDKFPAESKKWATRRTQEINNARDELRRYWRERERRLAVDQTEPEYELRVRRRHRTEPGRAEYKRFRVGRRRDHFCGIFPAAEQTLAPGLGRGAVFAYGAAALFAFVAFWGSRLRCCAIPAGAPMRARRGPVAQPGCDGPIRVHGIHWPAVDSERGCHPRRPAHRGAPHDQSIRGITPGRCRGTRTFRRLGSAAARCRNGAGDEDTLGGGTAPI